VPRAHKHTHTYTHMYMYEEWEARRLSVDRYERYPAARRGTYLVRGAFLRRPPSICCFLEISSRGARCVGSAAVSGEASPERLTERFFLASNLNSLEGDDGGGEVSTPIGGSSAKIGARKSRAPEVGLPVSGMVPLLGAWSSWGPPSRRSCSAFESSSVVSAEPLGCLGRAGIEIGLLGRGCGGDAGGEMVGVLAALPSVAVLVVAAGEPEGTAGAGAGAGAGAAPASMAVVSGEDTGEVAVEVSDTPLASCRWWWGSLGTGAVASAWAASGEVALASAAAA